MRRLVLMSLCGVCCAGCVGINQGGRPLGSILRADASPQPGEWCRITYAEERTGLLERTQSQITGRVESVDEDGLHLSHVSGRTVVKTPGLDRVPIVRRMFQNTGVGTEPDQVVRLDDAEQLEIISKEEAWQPNAQVLAQHLLAAVPGPNRLH